MDENESKEVEPVSSTKVLSISNFFSALCNDTTSKVRSLVHISVYCQKLEVLYVLKAFQNLQLYYIC